MPVTSASITYGEYPSVAERADALGVRRPTGLTMLPRNFATANAGDDLLAEATDSAVRTLWRQADLEEERLDSPEAPFPRLSEHHADWIGPTIFVSSALLSESSALVAVALGVITNYVTDLFKGVPGRHTASLKVVVERKNGDCVSVAYKGPATKIGEIMDAVTDLTSSDG